MIRDADVLALPMGEFTFTPEDPFPGQTGVVVAYAVRHPGGVLLFDTGFPTEPVGRGADLDAFFELLQIRARALPEVLADVGVDVAEVTAVANCHLHFDHSGQNARFPNVPIYVQSAELAATSEPDYTLPEVFQFQDARFEAVDGDHDIAPGIRIIATPGHSPGHQSLVVDTADGPIVLAGQAVYSQGEWQGIADAREGASRAPDAAAYARSVERLRRLRPKRVLFGHDHRGWPW